MKGYNARDIKKKLSALDLAELPTVDEAREQVQAMQQSCSSHSTMRRSLSKERIVPVMMMGIVHRIGRKGLNKTGAVIAPGAARVMDTGGRINRTEMR